MHDRIDKIKLILRNIFVMVLYEITLSLSLIDIVGILLTNLILYYYYPWEYSFYFLCFHLGICVSVCACRHVCAHMCVHVHIHIYIFQVCFK